MRWLAFGPTGPNARVPPKGAEGSWAADEAHGPSAPAGHLPGFAGEAISTTGVNHGEAQARPFEHRIRPPRVRRQRAGLDRRRGDLAQAARCLRRCRLLV